MLPLVKVLDIFLKVLHTQQFLWHKNRTLDDCFGSQNVHLKDSLLFTPQCCMIMPGPAKHLQF